MFQPMPEKIIYCYGAYQPLFNTMKDVIFEEGLPTYLNEIQNALIIVDDLMSELVQNVFHQGSQMRNISLNSHYLVLFKNPRDKSQITHLAKQMFPGKNKSIQEIFDDATQQRFGYLFLDFHPMTEDSLRMRTGIFPGDTHYLYQPR
ncbi:hypothetical protein RF55_21314 [Lasius niger]|uniref:Uncharacterized protein n=1 Tax=Lasius niger TaxID=67767 RepID=A0A0J7JY54_LASNI|nr:hypothetical protein RF55_21314 [Lasius niger]